MIVNLSLNDSSSNSFPWVVDEKGTAVKGHIYENGVMIKNNSFYNFINHKVSEDNYFEILEKLNGYYGLILNLGNKLIVSTDLVNSVPIFYKVTEEAVLVGDNYNGFLSAGIELNANVIDQYLVSGYCYGNETLLNNVYQLLPGNVLIIDKQDGSIVVKPYYEYIPKMVENNNKSDLIDVLHSVHLKVFRRLVSSLDGRRVILPLSGGYDSRLILEMLKNLGYENILCVTWGKPTDWQAIIAKKVALDLNVDWMLINPSKKDWQDWYSKNFEDEMIKSGAIAAIPYLQENLLIKQLQVDNILRDSDIFISGNSGDFIEGEHIPEIATDSLGKNEILTVIKDKHQRLNILGDYKNTDKSIADELELFEKKQKINNKYFFEYWEWKERQSKFVTNCIKPFENQGYEWRMPFWDKEIMNFWRDVDFDIKAQRKLFYRYSENYMNQLTADANPNISLFKKYLERVLDPRFGCYNEIKFMNLFTKNIDKIFEYVNSNQNIEKQYLIYYKINSLVALDVVNRLTKKIENIPQ